VTIAFITVLIMLTLLAGRISYKSRGAATDNEEKRVFRRFVAGLVVFWIVAIAAFLWRLG
jgi:hypothetical protein